MHKHDVATPFNCGVFRVENDVPRQVGHMDIKVGGWCAMVPLQCWRNRHLRTVDGRDIDHLIACGIVGIRCGDCQPVTNLPAYRYISEGQRRGPCEGLHCKGQPRRFFGSEDLRFPHQDGTTGDLLSVPCPI